MADAAASAPAGGSKEPPEGMHKMSMSHEQRLAEAARLREKGNAQFRAGDLERAEATYEEGASLFTYMNAESPLDPSYAEQNLESCNAAVPLYNNLALCLQRRRNWSACADACTEALDLLPDDRKATLRRGVVRVELDLWDEAEADLKRALALDPKGRETRDAVANARAAIANARRLQDAKDKKVLAGCFDRLVADEKEGLDDMDGVDGGVGPITRAGLYDAADVARPNEAFPLGGRRLQRPITVQDVDAELRLIDDEDEEAKTMERQNAYNLCVSMNAKARAKDRAP
jgi:tetratricopeptide (TPR) repeat protein